jgi:hypothetical protein
MPQWMAVDQKRFAAVLAVGVILCAAAPAQAQRTRVWAGADVAATAPESSEEIRLAANPAAAVSVPSLQAVGPPVNAPGIASGSLLSKVVGGGILMVPLIGCSLALAVFGIERAVSLRTGRVVPRMFVDRFIGQLQDGGILAAAGNCRLRLQRESGGPRVRCGGQAVGPAGGRN